MTLVPVDRPIDSNAEVEDVTGELRGFYDPKEPLLLFHRDRWVSSWLVCALFSLLALLTSTAIFFLPCRFVATLIRDRKARDINWWRAGECTCRERCNVEWLACCMVWYVSSNRVWLTNLTCLLVIHGNLSDITRWSRGVFGVRICEFPVFHHLTYGNLQCCLYSIVQIGRDTIISRQLGCLIDQEY